MAKLPRWDGVPQFSAEFSPDPTPTEDDAVGAPSAPRAEEHVPTSRELVLDAVISEPLAELMATAGHVSVVIELSVRYPGGTEASADRVVELLERVGAQGPALNGSYLTVRLRTTALQRLVELDRYATQDVAFTSVHPADEPADDDGALDPAQMGSPRGAIHRIWPNFAIGPLIHRSVVTTKCQAAHRSFNATGKGVVWAVLDSGIQADHPHFRRHENLKGLPHKSFVAADDALALVDEAGHGTHVAGILAGELAAADLPDADPETAYLRAATWYRDTDGSTRGKEVALPLVAGMASATRLLSCQVLRPDESGDITALLAALQYVDELNAGGRDLVVHGVNISVGHPFDPTWFATGLTPVCREVDLLVQSGVVVVIAAGNTGYGYARDPRNNVMRLGFDMTINDPGNAALGITVGSTSCSPHRTGVSYFSSKGPTGDGRMKPDLVAPGERVISAAAGRLADRARQAVPGAEYIENSGTSMAAPHVSGVAAGFLSVHREFIGHPERVRGALLGTATDLGRSAHFQGAGLVDAMRAIQSV